MPVPKRKRSKARRDKRFANKGLTMTAFSACPSCQKAVAPHQVCPHCGTYKGKKVMTTKIERALKRHQTKQASQKQETTSAPSEE